MFFTPLYGVRNTGCPQIYSKKKMSPNLISKKRKKEKKKKMYFIFIFYLGVIDPLKRFLHLKMLNSAPK
jgi:hypothetical protein